MPTATLEQLKKRQQSIKEKIRAKECELKRTERKKRAHILIQVGALIFSESEMKENGWKLSDIEATFNDRLGRFRSMVAKALEKAEQPKTTPVRQPLTTATTTAKPTTTAQPGQTVSQAPSQPVRQSVPPPLKRQ